MARLEIRNLTRRFGSLDAVKDVSLAIDAGEFFTLLGPSQQDAAAAKRPFEIGFATPKEGAVLAVDNFVLHTSGRRPDLAHVFLDFMLEGRNAADVSNLIGAGNTNAAAMAHILPEIAAAPGIFPPPADLGLLEMLRDFEPKLRSSLSRMWTEIKVR